MIWNRLAEARKCLSKRSGRARAVRELWSPRCCWKSDASAGDKKSAMDWLRASERGPLVCGITAESRTRAESPYPPSNTACILVRAGACTSGPSQRHAGRRAPHGTCPCTLTASRPARHRRLPRRPCLAPADAADAHTLAALAWCTAVPNARCPVPDAQCPVLPGVRCSMPSAVCPVPCAQCPMCPNALCPIDCSPVRCSAVRAAHVRAPVTPTSARRPSCATAERALQPLDCHCLPRV